MNCMICLIRSVYFIFIIKLALSSDTFKPLYKQDISEHCRRKVISSVFLGYHVVEANSKMLHFSRLDIPYNCVITIKTELGNHIILVIQVESQEGLEEACTDGDQLLVFNASETFGAYWAIPPQAISRDVSNLPSSLYTMPSTKTEPTDSIEVEEYKTEAQENEKVTADSSEQSTQHLDVIEVEIPILNATGRLVPGDEVLQPPWEREENIDKLYDATPIAGVTYDRKIVPLVKVWTNTSGRRNQDEPLFDISYNEGLLRPSNVNQMMKVTEPTTQTTTNVTTKTTTLQTTNENKSTTTSQTKIQNTESVSNTLSTNVTQTMKVTQPTTETTTKTTTSPTTNENKSTTTTQTKIRSTESTWNPYTLSKSFYGRHYRPRSTVRNIFQKRPIFTLRNKKLSRGKTFPATEEYLDHSQTEDLKLKSKINLTTMSTPGTYSYEFNQNTNFWEGHRSINNAINKAHISRLKDFTSFTKNRIIQSASENPFKNFMKPKATLLNERTFKTAEAIYPLHLEDDKHYGNYQSSTKTLSTSPSSVTSDEFKIVVDNIPMDNVKDQSDWNTVDLVKSASSTPIDEMSILSHPFKSPKFDEKRKFVNHESWENLVHSAPEMVLLAKSKHEETTTSESVDATLLRKKRYIEKISIANAKPEAIVDTEITSTDRLLEPDVLEDLSHLIELTDDEITGRVSQNQMMNVIASEASFNICSDNDRGKHRYVILLEASRVVLLINNYTLKGMTIVMTSATRLYDTDDKCSQSELECQVSGHRVCIESSCACDGVPNCGSYDIYDEDRLRCESTDTHYDIYLAILAFLSLILTLIYTVYFWLQRCVPQVSKAFFVYIAGTENDLYLKSIMRSPHDIDDISKHAFHPDDFETSSYFNTQPKVGVLKYLWLMCIRCITCSDTKEENTDDQALQKIYSFTEFEINNMSGRFNIDVGVQTGDSLEKVINTENILQTQKLTVKDIKDHIQMSKALTPTKPSESMSNTQQEMKLLTMFNKSRSDVATNTKGEGLHLDRMFDPERMITERNHDHEEELHVYDLHKHDNSPERFGDSISMNNELDQKLSESKKKLRFEESSEMSFSNYNVENIASTSHKHKMHPLFEMFRRGDADVEGFHEKEHPEYGPQHPGQHESQLKRFWNRDQHKKKRKKSGQSMPMRKL